MTKIRSHCQIIIVLQNSLTILRKMPNNQFLSVRSVKLSTWYFNIFSLAEAASKDPVFYQITDRENRVKFLLKAITGREFTPW